MALVALAMALPRPALPATITVDNPVIGDGTDGLCDLVEAIQNAEDDAQTNTDCVGGEGGEIVDVIELTVDVTLTEAVVDSPQTRGGVGTPIIESSMVIQSDTSESPDGATVRTIQRDPGAADLFRLFFVRGAGDLTLNDLIVTGGRIEDHPAPRYTVGGGIVNAATLTLTNTTVSGNSVSSADYPYAYPEAYGGGIFNIGDLTVADSTISGNSVYTADSVLAIAAGGGIAQGAINYNQTPTMALSYSTVSGNTTNAVGGEVGRSYGGGLYFGIGDTVYPSTVVNSTISGNTSQSYGTLGSYTYGAGIEVGSADVTLTHSTVSSNVKLEGGAMVDNYAVSIDVIAFGSLIAYGNVIGNANGENCIGVTDGGSNLADDDTCDTIPDTLAGLDPVLADNGGPTRTHRMTSTSTARDAGGACALPTDQRGVDRSIDGLCDSGSYEFFCGAADENVLLADDVLAIERTVEACGMITGGPSYEVVAGGNLIARAGSTVVLDNGFGVSTGGLMSVEIDPSIQMPDSESQPQTLAEAGAR